jgi:hypothetical protein
MIPQRPSRDGESEASSLDDAGRLAWSEEPADRGPALVEGAVPDRPLVPEVLLVEQAFRTEEQMPGPVLAELAVLVVDPQVVPVPSTNVVPSRLVQA